MIETDRLILRPWLDSDAEALFRYASDPDVGLRAGWPPHKDIEESRRVIRDIFTNDRTWAVTLRETGEAIGCMGYFIHGESNIPIGEEDAEIGYWIAKPYWNRGIATEALRAMIDYCFNVKGFLSLWSDFFIDNPASGRVMEKCGFKDTGEINWCSHLFHGEDRPVHIMKLNSAKRRTVFILGNAWENNWFSYIMKSREGFIPLSLCLEKSKNEYTKEKKRNYLREPGSGSSASAAGQCNASGQQRRCINPEPR